MGDLFLLPQGFGKAFISFVLITGDRLGKALVILLLLDFALGGQGFPQMLFVGVLNFLGGFLQASFVLLPQAHFILTGRGRFPGFGQGLRGFRGAARATGHQVLASLVLGLKLLALDFVLLLVAFNFVRQLGFIVLLKLSRSGTEAVFMLLLQGFLALLAGLEGRIQAIHLALAQIKPNDDPQQHTDQQPNHYALHPLRHCASPKLTKPRRPPSEPIW